VTLDCTAFLENFVLPLVGGGVMHVGAPIDVDALMQLERDLPHASVPLVAIDEIRHQVIAQTVLRPPSFVFGEDELSLAVAVHNLLFFAHPDAQRWHTSKTRKSIAACARRFAAQPLATHRDQALLRHGLLHNLLNTTRTDIKLSWWTGSATFQGQEIPMRLSRWAKVRRVHKSETTVPCKELFTSPEVVNILRMLLRRSPLTRLQSDSDLTHLHWEDLVFLLRDPEIARAISHASLQGKGLAILRAPARFAASLESMLKRSPHTADLRAVLAFLVHLNVLLALSEEEMTSPSPLLGEALRSKDKMRCSLGEKLPPRKLPCAILRTFKGLAYPLEKPPRRPPRRPERTRNRKRN